MSPIVLAEADFILNAEGVPYSQDYDDVYHPGDGGPGQARHVFLGGNGLPARWQGREQFTILETGFGLGLNFLETWRALDESPQAPRLHYLSVENRPLSRQALARAQARWPEHAARSRELLQDWPLPLRGFHRLEFAGGRIALTLLLGDAEELLPQVVARVDACYLDGFSPRANPHLWSERIFAQLARLAAPGATLATWSVAAAVRNGLAAAGFGVEKRRGYGPKRDMLAGEFRGAAASVHAISSGRRVLVIGAGLAGAACAERLAARGWDVEVLEQHAAAAQEASGNPAGLLTPLINFADAPNAQLSRLAFAHARRRIASIGNSVSEGVVLGAPGVLRIARTLREAERWQRLLAERAYPEALASYADETTAADLAGRAVSRPGVWFALGTTVNPPALCAALLGQEGITTRFGSGVAGLRHGARGWDALDHNGQVIASAPVIVVACALHCMALVPGGSTKLRLETARGQISLLPPHPGRQLKVPVAGESHAIPLPDGRLLIGATFQPLDTEPALRDEDHAANLRQIDTLLPGLCANVTAQGLAGRVGFRTVTPDRLPVYGAVSDSEGLYLATGLGARGIAWAPLGAELLASQICEEPWPLPQALAAEVSAQRFAKQR